ncbi:hypothetical protein HHK36_007883 [Tetracentron sinense]|uniref:Uncharacterized protein n=1 Tax=Tetracentron sinense TaxID=13715 RepID=A0A834ZFF2_TETSI|nr:hypothetical protein HHK36_007883 [Tetracentron sinense]
MRANPHLLFTVLQNPNSQLYKDLFKFNLTVSRSTYKAVEENPNEESSPLQHQQQWIQNKTLQFPIVSVLFSIHRRRDTFGRTGQYLWLDRTSLEPSSSSSDLVFSSISLFCFPSCRSLVLQEQAIAEKGFYLHRSPLSTPRGSEPPELLPLFPLSSPKQQSGDLDHLEMSLGHFKNWTIPESFTSVHNYIKFGRTGEYLWLDRTSPEASSSSSDLVFSSISLFCFPSCRSLVLHEKAIAEKEFYLHRSPLSTPRGSEPPELLPLFP